MRMFVFIMAVVFITLSFAAPAWADSAAVEPSVFDGSVVENIVDNAQSKFFELMINLFNWVIGLGSIVMIRFFAWFESRNKRVKNLEAYNEAKEAAIEAYKDVAANLKKNLKEAAADGNVTPEEAKECFRIAVEKAYDDLKKSGVAKKLMNAGVNDVKRYLGNQVQHYHDTVVRPLKEKK